jgi:hypothetical protein
MSCLENSGLSFPQKPYNSAASFRNSFPNSSYTYPSAYFAIRASYGPSFSLSDCFQRESCVVERVKKPLCLEKSIISSLRINDSCSRLMGCRIYYRERYWKLMHTQLAQTKTGLDHLTSFRNVFE